MSKLNLEMARDVIKEELDENKDSDSLRAMPSNNISEVVEEEMEQEQRNVKQYPRKFQKFETRNNEYHRICHQQPP